MKTVWQFLYNFIVIPHLYAVLRLMGLFNSKTQRGINGRKRVFENIIISALRLDKSRPVIWFHSSSLGEFEQAKPIIQKLKKEKEVNLIVTFFSPSGYENSLKYPYADIVSYIPFDTTHNAKTFIHIVKPAIAIMMRYDIWPNHIWTMIKEGVPVFIVDATMRSDSTRLLPIIKNFHKYLFKDLDRILTVGEDDLQNFKKFGCTEKQLRVVGDTRFDRVYQQSLVAKEKSLLNENLYKGKKVIVAGSTWEQDEEIILPVFQALAKYEKNILFIIAPHEPTLIHLEKIENEFAGKVSSIRFSYLNNYNNEQIILVDSIGILLSLYSYADAAFVGGSFKYNIHNVLEAAVYGIPVIFGPKIENSKEARDLITNGGGILVKNKQAMYRNLRTLLNDDKSRDQKGKAAFDYVKRNVSATSKILEEIYKYI
ncbi:MAG TPA: glycosyltransferase N-terminal domain-containing protein [Ignavibacteriaceae bacterium]|nr:glycosyltransferase N-terminal domain-containing protein [Ignavibacteriaceae bacterium]